MSDSASTSTSQIPVSNDGNSLKARLQRAERRNRIKAFLLVSPLLLFLLAAFVFPIVDMLKRSVNNTEVSTHLPKTVAALQGWDGEALPEEPVFAALAADLTAGAKTRTIGKVATRLNYERSGARSLVTKSARKLKRVNEGPYKEALLKIHEDWGDIKVWKIIQRESSPYTLSYYLSAIDLRYDENGEIASQPEHMTIHNALFWRTMWMSALITFLCLLLGYPIAYLLANLPLRYSNLLMILVLLPFWTSLLVRTATWIAILQQQGVLNDIMVGINLIAEESRIQMVYNKIGTLVAMTHILLPFMILPLYSVMKTIPPTYMRAARSMGAPPSLAFRRVYFPQTIPGIGAGSILVFILSIGYYITPALVGGRTGQFITNLIAYHMQSSLNWGLAAAIATILLIVVIVFYMVYNRLIGIDNVKLG